MTGRFPWRLHQKGNGYKLEPGRPTLASLTKSCGYQTAAIGKWHLGYGKDCKNKKLNISHNVVLISTFSIIILIAVLIGYLKYFSFKKPPEIKIKSPINGIEVNQPLIYLEGKTSPEAEVYLNNSPIPLDEKGNFKENIYLSQGVNNITITAVNQLGIQNKKTLTIYNKAKTQDTNSETTKKGSNKLEIKHISEEPTFTEVKDKNKTLFSGYFISKTQKTFYGEQLSIFTDKGNNLEIFYNGNPIQTPKDKKEFFKEFKELDKQPKKNNGQESSQ